MAVCDCLAVAPRSLSWWCVKWIARHLQFKSENTTNEVIFRVRARETSSESPKCPLDYCSADKHWFWQTGGSQLFLDCLVGAVSRQEKKPCEGIAIQFVQMAEEVRMNNNHGRKMLITEKHHRHDLMILEVVYKLR